MNRFKKEIRRRGYKLEEDYECLPCGDIDAVGVKAERAEYWFFHFGLGIVRVFFDRSMNTTVVYED